MSRSKTAIVGAGMTGAYLYRLLKALGHPADIFTIPSQIRCGLTPCAWGTSNGFTDLVRAAGLNPEKYSLQQPASLLIDEVEIKADLMTFDKSRLIRDLLSGANVKQGPFVLSDYERVIDATGVARAVLPPIEKDVVLDCVQYMIRTDKPLKNRVKLGSIGYAWCFPLFSKTYHIGCGSFIDAPETRMKELGWIDTGADAWTVICDCRGRIRLTAPHYSLPLVTIDSSTQIWGVGEAIGCVAPLAGDGVVTGMRSAQLLLSHWDDPGAYQDALLKEFEWMRQERMVLDRLIEKRALGIKTAQVLRKNARRMGMNLGLKEAAKLLHRLV